MIVSIQDVTFTYPGADEPALRNLSLEVPQGAFMALVGNNGSGKTTLCKLLTGLVPHFFQGDIEGEVLVDGLDMFETRVSELARHVGYVYQDFENQLLKPRVIDDVGFAPLNFGLTDYVQRAERALDTLGLSALRDRIIWELSGGEQHLIALAGALALDPSIIVIDEPVSQLDPVNARQVYDKLAMLNRDHGKTILVIEHHPDFIGSYCDSVALLTKGRVVWHLSARQALSRVDELEAHDILAPQVTRIARQVVRARPDGPCVPEGLPIKLEEGERFFAHMRGPEAPPPLAATPRRGEPEPSNAMDAPVVISFEGVGLDYATLAGGQHRVLDGIDLALRAGERVALVGANGAGKSTLMRLVTGLARPTRGAVRVSGADTAGLSSEQLANEVALIYQDPQRMFIDDNIRGDVAFFPSQRNLPDVDEMVERALVDFRLVDLQERDGRLLSGGQMRRASFAIGACMRPKVLLLDEPTSSLDVANRRQVRLMLQQIEAWVQTVIIATHDMELVAEWASRVIALREGRVLYDGAPEGIFGDPALLDAARIRAPQVVRLSNALGLRPVHLTMDRFVAAALAALPEHENGGRHVGEN